MAEISYYTQVVTSYLKQNALQDVATCLSDNIPSADVGKYICAMANTAALKKTPYVYAFWGIDETSKSLTNTNFPIPDQQNLAKHLSSNTIFCFQEVYLENHRVVVLEVNRVYGNTIQYDGVEFLLSQQGFIRLDNASDESSKLWNAVYTEKETDFAADIAMKNITANEVSSYLDWQKLFDMLEKPYPNSLLGVMSVLAEFRFVTEEITGKYNITNLGALLLARRLSVFKTVEYKAIRVLIYSGTNYTEPAHEQIGGKGYIIGFEGLIKYIVEHLPKVEYIDGALRKTRQLFPTLSIRELVANAIIHQDLNEKGSPVISIFEDHIVISNPGVPVIEKDRFIDTPPYSRNESLAAAMHRVGICEERGSGYDKVVSYIEENNLLAPEITVHDKRTTVTLRKEKNFSELTKDELIRICYDHACLNYIQGKITNNASLRARFNLEESERYKISRAFKPAIEAGLIKEKESTGPKNREYIPFWAN